MYLRKNMLTISEEVDVLRKSKMAPILSKEIWIRMTKVKHIQPPIDDADAVNKIYVDNSSDETKRYVDSVTPFVNRQN